MGTTRARALLPPQLGAGDCGAQGTGTTTRTRTRNSTGTGSLPEGQDDRPSHEVLAATTQGLEIWRRGATSEGGGEASYASSTSWETQLRPPRGAIPAPAPFTGRTLDDLRRIDPLHPLPEESFVGWCEVCDQCVVSESAHNSSPRHKAREQMYQTLQAAMAPGPQQQVARRLLSHLQPEPPAPIQRIIAPPPAAQQEDPPEGAHLLDMDDH